MPFRFRVQRAVFLPLVLIIAWAIHEAAVADDGEGDFDSLVSVDWLNEHLHDPDLVVLDCSVLMEELEDGTLRASSGKSAYEAGHIPTAGFADLTGALSDTDSPFEYAVPSPEAFAAAMGRLGVGDDTRVVLYDSFNSVWAARVWWMLRWVGFDRAALLDGGFAAWQSKGLPVSTKPAKEPVRTLTVALRPELISDRDEVLAAIDDAAVTIIDTLPEAQYRGDIAMYARRGHIKSATNVSVMALRDESGLFKAHDELDSLFDSDREERAITYCGGGIAASSNAFVMTRLGFKDVAVYTASLQEWAADPDLPMEVSPARAAQSHDQ